MGERWEESGGWALKLLQHEALLRYLLFIGLSLHSSCCRFKYMGFWSKALSRGNLEPTAVGKSHPSFRCCICLNDAYLEETYWKMFITAKNCMEDEMTDTMPLNDDYLCIFFRATSLYHHSDSPHLPHGGFDVCCKPAPEWNQAVVLQVFYHKLFSTGRWIGTSQRSCMTELYDYHMFTKAQHEGVATWAADNNIEME